ncbi:MAG: hypothetical protein E6Q40_07625 [Cupriavidus sp.]|nr:MAG: hypothetical protein E6Q40_07625 [Cupriavidus sp.]
MTMRTIRHFLCPAGHEGVETTSENDQPRSAEWSSLKVSGLREAGTDALGYPIYTCLVCGAPAELVRRTPENH